MSDYVILLEDDILLYPDALEYFEVRIPRRFGVSSYHMRSGHDTSFALTSLCSQSLL